MADARPAEMKNFSDGWVKYAWLVYLLGIPLTLWGNHARTGEWVFEFAGLIVFVALYLVGYRCNTTLAMAAVVGAIWLLGAIYTPRNSAAMCYYIYAAAFVGFAFDRSATAYAVVAALTLGVGVVAAATHDHVYAWAPAMVFTALIGAINVRAAEMKRAGTRLRQAYEQVEQLAAVAERERIARDLHDVLGHTLSLIVLKSELAAKLADRDPARAGAEIRDVERIARQSLGELRQTVAGYRAMGVTAELEHARATLVSAGLRVDCEAGDVRALPAAQEGVLALAIREAVTNVVRHAHASAVRVRIGCEGNACRFEIADDGRGGSGPEGFGLTGMRERVEALGGSLERIVDGGTRLVVTLPLGAAR